jgi:signal transduction histidine kinase
MFNDFKFSYVNIDQAQLTNELNSTSKYYANVIHWSIVYAIPIFWLIDYLCMPSEWVVLLFVRLIVGFGMHIVYLYAGKKRWTVQKTMLYILLGNCIMHAAITGFAAITQLTSYFLIFSVYLLLINLLILWRPLYSIIICLVSYVVIAISFKIFNGNNYGYDVLMSNGGIIFFVLSAFSCLIAFNRYQLTRNDIAKSIVIDDANNRLIEQNEQIRDQQKQIQDVNKKIEKQSDYRLSTLNMILHDFRNFTGSIQMSLDLLKNNDGNLESEQKEILEYIGVGNDKLKYLSEKLAASADGNMTQISYNNTYINLAQEVENCIVGLNDAAQLKQLHLQLSTDASAVTVYLDKIFLDQVLHKLIANAIRFAASNSVLAIKTFKQADKAVIEILNKGKLLGNVKLNELFNKLEALKDNDTNATKSALGFSVAKSLAEQMGGKLTYNSDAVTGNFYRLEFNLTQ